LAVRSSAGNHRRTSFAKITEPLEVPPLISLQTSSFDWLVGGERWEAEVAARRAAGEDVSEKTGLQEIFEEISPIEDFSETMMLSFDNPVFLDEKYTEEECKEKDFTYSRPLYVSAEFMNHETGEIKGQTVFMGDFPMMTRKGTFIINGTERVVVSQLVRSPGVYFESSPDKTSDKDIFTAKLIPSRGAWLEFEIDKRDLVGVRLDRKRKQNVTVLLKALGWTTDQIREEFGQYESMMLTLEKDSVRYEVVFEELQKKARGEAPTAEQVNDEVTRLALLDIYRKLRPGEPPTAEAAQTLLNNYYFNSKRYDLAKVGRYKINKKLGLHEAFDQQTLTIDDVVAAIRYVVQLHAAGVQVESPDLIDAAGAVVEGPDGAPVKVQADDIDHFGNRRMRTVGELIQNQLRTGLARMERVVRERMTTQDVEAITPQSLINIRPVVAALKEFFGTSQLSQFMDQTNPIAGLTHKRRLSALGPGGLSRDRAGMEVRDVHTSHYGRMCPIETPEGPNIGLIGSLSSYGRNNPFGIVESPYRVV
jgi:DNA-directed RNA polymerase subunit beta